MILTLYDLPNKFLEDYEIAPDEYELFIENGVLKATVYGTKHSVIIQDLPDDFQYLFNGIKVVGKARLLDNGILKLYL